MGTTINRGNRLYKISDNSRVVVRQAAALLSASDPVTAEGDADAQTDAIAIRGVTKIDYFIDVTANPNSATFLYFKIRFSEKSDPSVSNVNDWSYICIDNIDTANGISSVQEYMVKVDLQNVNGSAFLGFASGRRYVIRIEQISGIFASAIVYADQQGVQATISAVRHG